LSFIVSSRFLTLGFIVYRIVPIKHVGFRRLSFRLDYSRWVSSFIVSSRFLTLGFVVYRFVPISHVGFRRLSFRSVFFTLGFVVYRFSDTRWPSHATLCLSKSGGRRLSCVPLQCVRFSTHLLALQLLDRLCGMLLYLSHDLI